MSRTTWQVPTFRRPWSGFGRSDSAPRCYSADFAHAVPTVLLKALLKHFAAPYRSGHSDRVAEELGRASEGTLRWALDAGLGPLLHNVLRHDAERIPSDLRERLLSADLTAQVEHGERLDAAIDVVDACLDVEVPVTLLKGLSISEQHYDPGHLRPMTDIDILVPEEASSRVESLLLRRGYRHGTESVDEESHHGVPMVHPERGVWLELHTALFQRNSPLRRNGAFGTEQVTREFVEASFCGLPVRRLSNELQLAYVAAYWVQDLSAHRVHPSLVVPLFDAARLVSPNQDSIDWTRVMGTVPNDAAKASLYLLLAYLDSRGIVEVPAAVMTRLANDQGYVGSLDGRLINALVDRYLVGGRPLRLFNSWHVWSNLLQPGSPLLKIARLPWRILCPPTYPDRYDLRSQTARVGRLLRRTVGARDQE